MGSELWVNADRLLVESRTPVARGEYREIRLAAGARVESLVDQQGRLVPFLRGAELLTFRASWAAREVTPVSSEDLPDAWIGLPPGHPRVQSDGSHLPGVVTVRPGSQHLVVVGYQRDEAAPAFVVDGRAIPRPDLMVEVVDGMVTCEAPARRALVESVCRFLRGEVGPLP